MLKAVRVRATKRSLFIEFDDGNQVLMPWGVTPKLAHATDAERAEFRLVGQGAGIHWPQLDEELAVAPLAWREWPLVWRK